MSGLRSLRDHSEFALLLLNTLLCRDDQTRLYGPGLRADRDGGGDGGKKGRRHPNGCRIACNRQLTAQDLKAKQVNSFRDLQFHVPSVTFTKSNFGGAQFQIRGITTQFGLGAAIAQNLDDIYIEAPALGDR